MTNCSVSRTATSSKEVEKSSVSEVRDTVREEVLVFFRDTLRETIVITVDRNEAGDTLFRSVVTDRDRIRDREAVRDKEEKVVVRTDTMYVAVRDSVQVLSKESEQVRADRGQRTGDSYRSGGNALHRTLKWVFWIIVALTVLIGIVKFRV